LIINSRFLQLVQAEYASFAAKIADYFSSKWNLVDLLAIVAYFVGFGLRLNPSTMHSGHLILAFDTGIWILRLLHVFYVNRVMGPYVVMIYRMVCYGFFSSAFFQILTVISDIES